MRHRLASALCAAVAAAALLTGVSTALLAEIPVCTGYKVRGENWKTFPEKTSPMTRAQKPKISPIELSHPRGTASQPAPIT